MIRKRRLSRVHFAKGKNHEPILVLPQRVRSPPRSLRAHPTIARAHARSRPSVSRTARSISARIPSGRSSRSESGRQPLALREDLRLVPLALVANVLRDVREVEMSSPTSKARTISPATSMGRLLTIRPREPSSVPERIECRTDARGLPFRATLQGNGAAEGFRTCLDASRTCSPSELPRCPIPQDTDDVERPTGALPMRRQGIGRINRAIHQPEWLLQLHRDNLGHPPDDVLVGDVVCVGENEAGATTLAMPQVATERLQLRRSQLPHP